MSKRPKQEVKKREEWVFIKAGAEVDRRIFDCYQDADVYEQMARRSRGKEWCDSWCTVENARLLGYRLSDQS